MTAPLVVHIIPYDAIGGVEVAARTVEDGAHQGFQFAKFYLTRKGAENHPLVYASAVAALLRARPALLVASLWRSCLVLIALKILRPRTRCVTFLHSAVTMHFLDRWITRLAMLASDEIWADSQAALNARVPKWLHRPTRIISFLTAHQPPPRLTAAGPKFIYWGRLHWTKNHHRSVRLVAKIAKQHPNATFDIIGPDDGERSHIEATIARLDVKGVRLHGPMAREDIFKMARECCFYLQTSVDEGAAMSVIEAMQLGLIPVVTAVGGISSYCFDGDNAILLDDDDDAVERINRLLGYFHSFASASANAYRTWQERPLYRDDVLAACRQVLLRPPGR